MTRYADGHQGWLHARLEHREPTPGAMKVIRALVTHAREMSYASTAEAADRAGVNAATVVRAAQMLGFSGWPALRAEVRSRYLSGLSASEVLSEHAGGVDSPAWAAVRGDLRNLQELAQVLDVAQVERVARLIHDADRTVVLGSGSFAAPGLQLTHIGQTIGYDVRLHREGGTSLLNAVSLLGEGDCLVIYRLWRSPREVMNAGRVAKDRGARVVVVADRSTADVLELADELVLVPSEGASMFPSLTAPGTITHAVLASLVAMDEERARRASDRVEALWAEFGLFAPVHEDS
jgi:DNA-binding MurR/RpiR family transcriptional regulator